MGRKALWVLWEAGYVEQVKVISELGPGPGVKLDSLILVPEFQQLGFTGAVHRAVI